MSKVLKIHCTDFNASNAMYVGDIGDGVCSFYAHCMQSTDFMSKTSKILCTLYTVAPCHARREGCSCTVRPVGLVVHHHAVRGGSFVFKCSGTCQTTRVIAGKMHSQSPILKVYGGTQQPGNSYKAMTKLHPPHSNRTCHKQFRI